MTKSVSQPEFGQLLRRLRAERGLSQRDLAVGVVNQSYISLIESGVRVPTLEVVLHLARVLDVSLESLVGDVELITEQRGGGADQTAGEGGPGSGATNTEQFVHDLLTTSAVEHGDLARAQERLTDSYRSAVDSGGVTVVLTQGLALERVLGLRRAVDARYRLLKELLGVAELAGILEAAVLVRIDLASAARDIGQLAEALGQTERALNDIAATALWNGIEHVRLLSVHISALSDAGGGFEVLRFVDCMLELAAKIDSPAITGRAHWTASVALARLGENDRALRHLREAGAIFANPGTSLLEWARFSRAAASALLDAEGELPEITRYMVAARASTIAVAESSRDLAVMDSLEVRYALACGDTDLALRLAEKVDESQLGGFELVWFLVAVGRALQLAGRVDEAAVRLRGAAVAAEQSSAYRLATRIWRMISDLNVPR